MAIIQAFFDESGKKSDHPVVTFSGVCVGRRNLDIFDSAWRTLLRQYELLSLHMKHASRLSRKVGNKMLANQTPKERIDALIPFADCINEHLEIGLIQAWDIVGFNNLDKQLRWALGNPDDPYYLAFARSITELMDHLHEDDRVSLICDDDRETAWDCYRHYRGLQAISPEVRKKAVSLTFASDEAFPCLQAADMVAYLSRLEAKAQFYGDKYDFRPLFEYLTKPQPLGKMEWHYMFANEDRLRNLSLRKDGMYMTQQQKF